MPTSFLEIVELPDGRIALRRGDDEESLVVLDFSADAKAFLQGQHIEVAKARAGWRQGETDQAHMVRFCDMLEADFAKRQQEDAA